MDPDPRPRGRGAREQPVLARDDRLDRPVRRPARHGLGHHEQLPVDRRDQEHDPGRGRPRHRRGAVRDRARPDRRDPGADRLQQAVRSIDSYANRLSRASPRSSPWCCPRELDAGQGRPEPWRVTPCRPAADGSGAAAAAAAASRQPMVDDQHDAAGRRHAGAADRVHDHGAAADRGRRGRPAAGHELAAAGPGRAAERHHRRTTARSILQDSPQSSSTSSARGCRRSPGASPTRGSSCAATRGSTTAGSWRW